MPFRTLLAALLLLNASAGLAALPLEIETADGIVQGGSGRNPQIKVFKGIPYAAPPVGQNRWRPPQPAARWSGIRPATAFGPRCVQGGFAPGARQPLSSEDCLYLNLWSPAASPQEKLPVMVWIHGGGFFTGAASNAIYEGENLAAQGALIVTLNYRLGSFGFFAHPALSAESPTASSGNYAMLDMLAALQWVQKNIAAFGGDPDKVTVFGESAGAHSVAALVASPLAKGLFQRAIVQSGAWMGLGLTALPTLAEKEAAGLNSANQLEANSLDDLRRASAQEIYENFPGGGEIIVDGHFLPKDPSLIYAAGEQNAVDLMAGSNRDEAVFFGPGTETAEVFKADAEQRFKGLSPRYLSLYPAGNDSQANASYLKSFSDELAWQVRRLGNYQAQAGKQAYVYFFTHVPPGQEARGATHVAELAYVFNQHHQAENWQQEDRSLGEQISRFWVNFARHGDPNGAGLPAWPKYRENTPGNVLVLADTIETESAMIPAAEFLSFFEAAYLDLLQTLQD